MAVAARGDAAALLAVRFITLGRAAANAAIPDH